MKFETAFEDAMKQFGFIVIAWRADSCFGFERGDEVVIEPPEARRG